MERNRRTLVIGGARSGKSRLAEQLCRDSGLGLVYLATAQIFDEEMKARVEKHRLDRGSDWLTVEEPLALIEMLEAHAQPEKIILVDCLTLWLTNILLAEWDIASEVGKLNGYLSEAHGNFVFVSNEVGQGIVPENKLARRFRDEQGILNQVVAKRCDHVLHVVAGLPTSLKGAL